MLSQLGRDGAFQNPSQPAPFAFLTGPFTQSEYWTVQKTGWHHITLQAGGGASGTPIGIDSAGGGGGGCIKFRVNLTVGQVLEYYGCIGGIPNPVGGGGGGDGAMSFIKIRNAATAFAIAYGGEGSSGTDANEFGTGGDVELGTVNASDVIFATPGGNGKLYADDPNGGGNSASNSSPTLGNVLGRGGRGIDADLGEAGGDGYILIEW